MGPGTKGDLRFPGDLGSPERPPPPPPLPPERVEMARVETPAGRAVVIGGGIAVAALGACCAFHASGSNAPWLGGESSGQPPLKAALRPVRCGDSRLIPPSCNPGVSIRMGASVAALLRCRVSGDLERALCDDINQRLCGLGGHFQRTTSAGPVGWGRVPSANEVA